MLCSELTTECGALTPRTIWVDDIVKLRSDWTTLAQEGNEWKDWGRTSPWDIGRWLMIIIHKKKNRQEIPSILFYFIHIFASI